MLVNGLSNNSLIAAVFGRGSVTGVRGTGVRFASDIGTPASGPNENPYPQPIDAVEISLVGRRAGDRFGRGAGQAEDERTGATWPGQPRSDRTEEGRGSLGDAGLSPEDQQRVDELKRRDREVRQHEQAHLAAAGGHARGGASFEFETGPDGQQYAVEGEVSIDTSEVADNPQATVAKMQQVRRAALAPAHPSSQDRSVAAKAQAIAQKARAELASQGSAALSGGQEADESTAGSKVAGGLPEFGGGGENGRASSAIEAALLNLPQMDEVGLGLVVDARA